MVNLKIVSSLEKAFLDQSMDCFEPLEYISTLRGERISLQLLASYEHAVGEVELPAVILKIKPTGALADYVKIRNVRHMGVTKPTFRGPHVSTPGYLRNTPGVYPDLLEESNYGGNYVLSQDFLHSFWIDVELPDTDEFIGINELSFSVTGSDRRKTVVACDETVSTKIEVIDAALPDQELIMTQWLYCDTLAEYYNVPVWSEEHWRIIENFAKCAVKHGQNMLFTPIFTPVLDTYIGGERLTTQLIGVKVTDGKYSFDFSLLDRWIDMCDRIGVKYLEISHLFTQAGALHAPKIIAELNGEEKQIFGWETDAHSKEYGEFLRAFISELLSHLKLTGNDRRCFFHISDEPGAAQIEDYLKSANQISDLLEGYTVMDAVLSFEFYEKGIMKTPIPKTQSAAPFVEAKVPGLWVYYCGEAGTDCVCSSRMLAMPAARNRALGMQLYKYGICGFLHWGFNFYHTCGSYAEINPYFDQSGESWVPAGDMYAVYPAKDGTPLESTRLLVFEDGLKDLRAMRLCEKYYSHQEIVAEIEGIMGEEITFVNTLCDAKKLLMIRERINEMIKAKL